MEVGRSTLVAKDTVRADECRCLGAAVGIALPVVGAGIAATGGIAAVVGTAVVAGTAASVGIAAGVGIAVAVGIAVVGGIGDRTVGGFVAGGSHYLVRNGLTGKRSIHIHPWCRHGPAGLVAVGSHCLARSESHLSASRGRAGKKFLGHPP